MLTNRRTRMHAALAGLGLTLAAAAPGAGQDGGLVRRYRLTELRTEQSTSSRAYAINNTGQIIGYVTVGAEHHAAYWHNGAATDLHATVHFDLTHPYDLFDQGYSEAFGISSAGQIVGTARTSIDCPPSVTLTNAFLLRPAVQTDLATPYAGDALTNLHALGPPCTAYDSAAIGISNANHVVGWADTGDAIHAFLVTPVGGQFYRDEPPEDLVNDLMVDLGTLAASDPVSAATAVNDSGHVTGYSYTTAGGRAAYRAYLITPLDGDLDGVADTWFAGANGVNTLMTDLGTLGGLNSWGRAINNRNQVVGESDVDAPTGEHYTHAFLWSAGQMTDLGTLRSDPAAGFSAASDINDAGVVVGWAENDAGQRRAFRYENGVMEDLNELLYLVNDQGQPLPTRLVLTEARGINEDGLIVGWATVGPGADAATVGFLLTPVLVDPAALDGGDEGDGDAGGADGDDDFAGELIVGTPDYLVSQGPDGPDGGAPAGPALLLCGNGALALLPLTLLGAGWMRSGRRPRR